MASLNVEKMGLKDLLDLEIRVRKAISVAKERERADVKHKIAALAENAGFSVTELFGAGRGGAKGGKVAVKYVNPDNKSETWTGRGRQPRWLVSKLSKGGKIADFEI
jgi:DNA-binding protein H-NS